MVRSSFFSRTERLKNRDPDAYRYKWSSGSNNFQEHLEHFVSEQKSRFQYLYVTKSQKVQGATFNMFKRVLSSSSTWPQSNLQVHDRNQA
ncbi:hypothetical protein CTI12_AA541470 [Artemisia annua]|uniref:Ycf2 N-terminal domain-containing protein n=1 Tax=Artemisia annua TaxID=35608 RepID=A0A2U1L1D6_ARTAN|nr:hypothetical protein CTI12_AA541470 [Artemisia annua]